MLDNSKLEIFKIVLGNKTFREIGLEKCGLAKNASNADVFNALCGLIIQKLTNNSVWTHRDTTIGLTLFTTKGDQANKILSPHSDSYIIEGFIDGGLYDRIRMLAEKDDIVQNVQLGRNKIVTDRLYIYMYFPLGAKVGLFFLERKKRHWNSVYSF